MNYIFRTQATMKEYNNKKWWIDSGIISEKRINADSVEKALEIYRARVAWVTILMVVDTVF